MIRRSKPEPEPRWHLRAALSFTAGIILLAWALQTRPDAALANLVADTIIVGMLAAALRPLLPKGNRLRIFWRTSVARKAVLGMVEFVKTTVQDRGATVAALLGVSGPTAPEAERLPTARYNRFDTGIHLEYAVLELQAAASRSSLQQPFERLEEAMRVEDRYSDRVTEAFNERVPLTSKELSQVGWMDLNPSEVWEWLRKRRGRPGRAEKLVENPDAKSLLAAYLDSAREVERRCNRVVHIVNTEYAPAETSLRLAPPPYPRLLARVGVLAGLCAVLIWLVAAWRPGWFPRGFADNVYDNVETAVVVTVFGLAAAALVTQWSSRESAQEARKHMLRMTWFEQHAVSDAITGTPLPDDQYVWAHRADPSREEMRSKRVAVDDWIEKMQDAAYTLLGIRYDALTDALVDGVARSIAVWATKMDDLLASDAADPFDYRTKRKLFWILMRVRQTDERLTQRLMEVYGPPHGWDREEAAGW